MSWQNKVVWAEGLFLVPQLFQQQERYLESYAHKRAQPLSSFYWGLSRYEIDKESLSLGKLILKDAAGVFNDGTPFDIPGNNPPPPPLTILPEHLEQTIYLAIPIRVPNGEETAFDNASHSLARYEAFDYELCDGNAIQQPERTVQLSRLRMRLLPGNEMTDGWIGLPLTRIRSVNPNGSIDLYEDTHVPPVNAISADKVLFGWVQQIHGLVYLRAQSLAERLSGAGLSKGEAIEVADYLLLQILNRYDPYMGHLLQVGTISPEIIYTTLLSLNAELSTYVRPSTRRPKKHIPYKHDALYDCIKPLVDDAQQLLSEVLVRSAQQIQLDEGGHGMYLSVIDTTTLTSFSSLVIAAAAQMPMDVLQTRFIAQSKIAPSGILNDIVRSHLPGIAIQAMPVPPRQIPFNAGYIYFEILRNGPLWEAVRKNGNLAMHLAGEFPGLELQLWGIRDQ